MLTGNLVKLRAMEPSDIEPLFAWENNTENWLNSGTHRPFSRNVIEHHVLHSHDVYTDKQLRLIIVQINSDTPIGAIDLFECDFGNSRAGVGILIANTADRGKGMGKEALSLLCEYCREVLLLHQLHAEILVENERSIGLFQQAGFKQTGVRKDWIKTTRGFHDVVVLQNILHK